MERHPWISRSERLRETALPADSSSRESPAKASRSLQETDFRPFADLPVHLLFGQLFDEMNELVQNEVRLAKAELESTVTRGVRMAKWLGVAALCAGSGITLLLVAAVLALAQRMPGWSAALVIAGGVLLCALIAALVAWKIRIRMPLAATQRSIKGSMEWAKELKP